MPTQHKPASPQSVFRFVSVRAPRKLSAAAEEHGYCMYDAASPSTFVSALVATKNDTELSNEEKIEQIRTDAKAFKSSADAIKNRADLASAGQHVLDFADFLSTHRDNIKHSDVPADLGTRYVLGSSLVTKLWDNLIAMAIVGGQPELREVILQLLRLQHFVEKYDANLTEKGLRKLAAVQVTLPNKVFPLPQKEYVAPTLPEPSNEPHPLSVLQNQLSAINEAKATLEKLYKRQEKLFRKNSTENPTRDTLTQAAWDDMTEDMQNVLAEKEIEVGDVLTESIQILVQAAQDVYKKIWQDTQVNRRIIVANGTVYTQNNRVGNPFEDNVSPINPTERDFDDPYENFFSPNRPPLRCVSVGDYLRVEQTLCCYEPTEIAHIENILQGELKENSVRQFQQSVIEQNSLAESEEEKMKDSQSSDRYEMQKEMEKTSQFDASLSLGVSVSGPAGPVELSANTNFASSYSTSQSEHQAVNYAKDLTERTVNRIQKRVKEERKVKTTQEFEVINKHVIDNTANTDGHVVGIYRWVEKIYNAQVVNYGTRLTMEFMIPEPAAFHLWAMTLRDNPANTVSLEEPIHPNTLSITYPQGNSNQFTTMQGLQSANDINDFNYKHWAAAYGASVDAPPINLKHVVVGMVEDKGDKSKDDKYAARIKSDFVVEEGYMAMGVQSMGRSKTVGSVSAYIGHIYLDANNSLTTTPLPELRGKIELVTYAEEMAAMGIGFTFQLQRTPESYANWQIKTYQSILAAYERKKAAFDAAMASAVASSNTGYTMGTNPAMNKSLIQNELQKGCLRWLFNSLNDTYEHYNAWSVWYYSPDNDWTSRSDNYDGNIPVSGMSAVEIQAHSKIKFAENCFEWDLMSYELLPYFYGATPRWRKLYNLADGDPLMQTFLQAGMAKVIVPVRPGFEEAALHLLANGYTPYLATGGMLPAIDSDIYRAAMAEITEARQNLAQAIPPTPVGESWKVHVPTSLVVLQCESGCVAGSGLPCNCPDHESDGANTQNLIQGENNSNSPA